MSNLIPNKVITVDDRELKLRKKHFFKKLQTAMKILNALDVKKAHGHDNVNIWVLKICGTSASRLAIIFKNWTNYGKRQTLPQFIKK